MYPEISCEILLRTLSKSRRTTPLVVALRKCAFFKEKQTREALKLVGASEEKPLTLAPTNRSNSSAATLNQ